MIEITEKNEKTITEEIVKKHELRGLKATDMGAICKIIAAIGIREFKMCFDNENVKALIKQEKVNTEALGFSIVFDIADIIIANIPKAEKEIQNFLASVADMSISEVKDLSFAEYGEMIMEVVTKDDFKDFFGRVIKLFK